MQRRPFAIMILAFTAVSVALLALNQTLTALLVLATEIAIASYVTRKPKLRALKPTVIATKLASEDVQELGDTCSICGRPVRKGVAYCSECASKQS